MKLSVIDQSPVPNGFTPADALNKTIELARLADRLGYERYWIAEHHAMPTLACSAPEILITRIGAETKRMRVGSGGVMLPHYSPFKVAEQFRMLHALYPNRVDLGIGRAPGGSPLDAYALRRERVDRPMPDDFPEQLIELLAFLNQDFPERHPFKKILVSPAMPSAPDVWLLGSSMWSADAAAQLGLPYSFAHFISPEPTRAAIEHYYARFKPSRYLDTPKAVVALGAICAETDDAAIRLMASARLMRRRRDRGEWLPVPTVEEAIAELGDAALKPMREDSEWPRYFVGSPATLGQRFEQLASALKLDEIMIVTIVHDHQARLRSYELLAREFQLEISG
ncbi:MAG TPA: LLM class flavin-dependent oxidoreductase [Steroidobacteraceae bacterium]|nr:LLM class flavin-dependent oxidoreductase [Steroidobacteraceae bacterium]